MTELEQRIQDGLNGKFTGLSNGFNRINRWLFNVQRSTYYLIGGMSGTFKTTLVDFILLNALEDAKQSGIKLDVYYYSYEIDKVSKQCNWLSMLIYKYEKVYIPTEVIKGLGLNRLTDDELELVQKYSPRVTELFETINFSFKPTNPTGIYNELFKAAELSGTLHREKVNEDKSKIVGYTPNDPNQYRIVVMDHMALLQKERGFSTKEIIDKYSEYCVTLRNLFGYTFFNISQFNDGLSSVDRAKFKGVDLSPQMTDFKDTRNPYADADVAIGTMSPYKLDMDTWSKYNVKMLKGYLLVMKIIKNRLSTDNIAIGLFVNPKAGAFQELPLPTDTQTLEKVYKLIEKLDE